MRRQIKRGLLFRFTIKCYNAPMADEPDNLVLKQIYRLRGRYRALLREEVARTVATPTEVDEELRYLR
jgi:hypothetical protein